jgi:hypothetical protein
MSLEADLGMMQPQAKDDLLQLHEAGRGMKNSTLEEHI